MKVLSILLLGSLLAMWLPLPQIAHGASDVTLHALAPWFTEETPPWAVMEPALLRTLATASAAPLRIIVRLKPAAAPVWDADQLAALPATARRAQVVTALQAHHDRALDPLAPVLDSAQRVGDILARQDLWIIHSVALTVKPAFVWELARSPAVAAVTLDRYESYIALLERTFSPAHTTGAEPAWGVTMVRAPEVWETLAISGTGSVVAIFDTGVDWLHPALSANYRGRLGPGVVVHSGSWYDPTRGALYPHDDNGHGTHVAGTAVGGEGIGVAPGARWIAVKGFRGTFAYNSWLHAGFQWLLAPEGDPALAPDVVNCSWGNRNGGDTAFEADIAALTAAGIFVVTSAGNWGAAAGTMGAPASLPGVFAVGASDQDDDVANFSGRGPSIWDEIKPTVVAPGVQIYSALPGGIYDEAQGTSMASPHVTGVAALLRAVDATLTPFTLTHLLTTTAVPLTTTIPNNDSGWGRIDALAAVSAAAQPAWVVGNVRDSAGRRVVGAQVRLQPHSGAGTGASTISGADGAYRLALLPDVYDAHVSAFGYASQMRWGIVAERNQEQVVNFTLSPLPTGEVRGAATVLPGGAPPTRPVTITALGTPVAAAVDVAGAYALTLPEGTYTLEARGNGYRVLTQTATVSAGSVATRDWALITAPTLLLVDQGAWAYQGKMTYWRAGLDALGYAYTEFPIKGYLEDASITTTLRAYDVVLWSAPYGSPGSVRAGPALFDYLEAGGRLLLSGQDIAYFDSGKLGAIPHQRYLLEQLAVDFVKDTSDVLTVQGRDMFAGLSLTLNGPDSAANQPLPDVVAVRNPLRSTLLWVYGDGGGGGVGASICTPYRALLLPFGYEAITGAEVRVAVMERVLDWLTLPPPMTGLTLTHGSLTQIGLPGERLTYTLHLYNTGMGGPPAPLLLSLEGATWPATVTPGAVTLAPCELLTVTVTVDIPPTAVVDEADRFILQVHDPREALPLTVTLQAKTPASLLLVDAERYIQQEVRYMQALEALGIAYDVWPTEVEGGGPPGIGSPPLATLQRYPLVVWFTGYDWYQPVRPNEAADLQVYLEEGGRLLLSSQDYLYYNAADPLTAQLGVLTWVERATESAWVGAPHPAVGYWGPDELTFPRLFQNWSDVVEPLPEATALIRGDVGQPVAVAAEVGAARTVFAGFPLEALPTETLEAALSHAVGWLSPLGESVWQLAPANPQPGERVTYTLALRNTAPEALATVFSHTTPSALTVLEPTLPPALAYDAATRRISWAGTLAPGAALTFTWAAEVSPLATAQPLTATGYFALPEWRLAFWREAQVWVDGPALEGSAWEALPGPVQSGRPVTLTFTLRNDGPGAVVSGTVDLWLMPGLAPITATLPPTLGTSLHWWEGALPVGAQQVLTISVSAWQAGSPLRIDALIDSGAGARWVRSLWLEVPPQRRFLPVLLRNYGADGD